MTTKSDLVSAVASSASITKAQASSAVEALFDTISLSLTKGEDVTLIGFGSFKVSQRQAREGRNPRTGETIKIPAKKSVTFVSGKGLKDAVNK